MNATKKSFIENIENFNAINGILLDEAKIKELIHSVPNGKMFAVAFYRKEYICGKCGKKLGRANSCECGNTNIIKTCCYTAQKAVSNPKNALKPGTGMFKGQSAENAEKHNNNFKFYATNGCDDKGKGVYRQCGFNKVYYLQVDGIEYKTDDIKRVENA
jgi:hypothetical protein